MLDGGRARPVTLLALGRSWCKARSGGGEGAGCLRAVEDAATNERKQRNETSCRSVEKKEKAAKGTKGQRNGMGQRRGEQTKR